MASSSRSSSPSLRRLITYPPVTKTRSTGIRRRHSLFALLRRIRIKIRPSKSQFLSYNRRRSQANQNGLSRPSISHPIAVEAISVNEFSRRQQLSQHDTHRTPATPSPMKSPTPLPESNFEEGRHGLWNKIQYNKNDSRTGSIAMSPASCYSIETSVKDETKAPEVSFITEPPSPKTSGRPDSKKVPRRSHSKEGLSFRERFHSGSSVSESKLGRQSLSLVDLPPTVDDQAPDASSLKTGSDKCKSIAPVHAPFDFEQAVQGLGSRGSFISPLDSPICPVSNMSSENYTEASRGPSFAAPTSGDAINEEIKRAYSVPCPSPEQSISGFSSRSPVKLAPLNTNLSASSCPRVAPNTIAPSEASTRTNVTISRMPPSPVDISPSSMVPCTVTDLDVHPALRSSALSSADSARTATTSPINTRESTQIDDSIAEVTRDWHSFLAAAENKERRPQKAHFRGRSAGYGSGNRCESIGAVLGAATQPSSRISGVLTHRITAPDLTDISECHWSLDHGPESPSSSQNLSPSQNMVRGELGDPWSSDQPSDLHRKGALGGKACGRSSGSPTYTTDFAKNQTARVSLGAIGVAGPRKRTLPILSLDLASDDTYHSRRTKSVMDTTRAHGDNNCDQMCCPVTSDSPKRLAQSPFTEAILPAPLEVTGVERSGIQWGSSRRDTTQTESTISDRSSKRRRSSLSQNLFESALLSQSQTHDTIETAARRSKFLEEFGDDNPK